MISSQLMLALFFLASFDSFANESLYPSNSKINSIATSPKWAALTHSDGDNYQINDPNFILSKENFSLKNELTATLTLITQEPYKAMCRFPARYLFLDSILNFKFNSSHINLSCPKLNEFNRLVPFDKLSLVFASEKLASSSSMMGHVFLKASGKNVNSRSVSHSIAFYSEIKTTNPLRLIYEGVVSGMDGLLIVKPFKKERVKYLVEEGRNLWSYGLDLSTQDKQLIQYHMWELKQIDIDYLFQSYNCATLTLDLLSLVNENIKNEKKLFVSPIDVIKAAQKHELIDHESVSLTDDWKLSMLSQQMDDTLETAIYSWIFEEQSIHEELINKQSRLLIKEYMTLMLKADSVQKSITADHLNKLRLWIGSLNDDDLTFNLANYKNPTLSKQDSIVGSQLIHTSLKESAILLKFIPASHELYGDNSQLFSESALKIAEINVNKFHNGKVKLDKLSLYDVQAYTPSIKGLEHYSGSFYMGYQHIYNTDLKYKGVFEISGSFGKTVRINDDILSYAVIGGGVGANKDTAYAFVKPQVGVIMNIIGNTKLLLDHHITKGRLNRSNDIHSSNLTFSWNGLKEITLYTKMTSNKSQGKRVSQYSLGMDYHF